MSVFAREGFACPTGLLNPLGLQAQSAVVWKRSPMLRLCSRAINVRKDLLVGARRVCLLQLERKGNVFSRSCKPTA